MKNPLPALAMGLALALDPTGLALAHGDAAPQPIDTSGLEPLGDDTRPSNPYKDNKRALEVGANGYNQNCARCHGLEAKSGGMAPDLREVDSGEDGDSYFLAKVRAGSKRDGRYMMPPFNDILSQEAIWAIRTYVDSQPKPE